MMNNIATNINSSLTKIKEKNTSIRDETIVLNTQRKTLEKDNKKMNDVILANSSFLDINAEVMDFLDKFSKRSYEENLLNYERLLSYYVNDVFMSKNVEEKEILIELVEKVNSLAIDIYIQNKGSENKEDIVKSNGGGIANIVAVGLKVLSLFNLNLSNGYRKFLVLDEADCWLKEPDGAKNEAFYKQLYEISKHCNMQIFIISHWDIPLSIPAKRIHLSLNKDKTMRIEDQTVVNEDLSNFNDSYVKKIALKNFESHRDTTIELSPRITILTGDNNIGKSAVVRAFRSVFFFDGSDLQINHEANEAKVYVELSDQQSVLWTRKRKGNIPEEYFLNVFNKEGKFSSKNNVNQAIDLKFSKKKMMETGILGEVFGIYKYNNLDLQLGDQKDPIGILKLDSKDKAIALFSDINFKFYKKLSETHKQNYRLKQVENTLNNKKIAENEKKLNVLENLQFVENIDFAEITQQINEFNQLEEKQNKLNILNGELEILKELKSLEKINLNKNKLDINKNISQVKHISELSEKLNQYKKILLILKELQDLKENKKIVDLKKKCKEIFLMSEDFKQIYQLNKQYKELNDNINKLYKIYFQQELDKLYQIKKENKKIINLVKTNKVLENINNLKINIFNKKTLILKIDEINNIRNKGKELIEKVKLFKLLEQQLTKLNEELNLIEQDKLKLGKIVCPLCRRPFNSKHEHE